MANKIGNGGHGMENYDPATGRYVSSDSVMSDELKSVMNLSSEDIDDENLKQKYNLTSADIEKNRQIDSQRVEEKKDEKLQKSRRVYDEKINNVANELYKFYESIEGDITKTVMSICEGAGGMMYGLDHRIKSVDSIKSKIFRTMESKNISLEEAKKIFYDGIRYTVLFETSKFSSSVKGLIKELKQNYKMSYIKNKYIDKNGNIKKGYRDINTSFVTPDGIQFEVQFNTIKGICAKNGKEFSDGGFIDRNDGIQDSHFYYEEKREQDKNDTNSTRARYLDYMIEKIWSGVPIPPDVEKIDEEE